MSVLSMSRRRVDVELRQFFREREAVIFVFAFPIVMLVIFASAFSSEPEFVSGTGGVSVTAAQYYLTGMISTGIMLTSFQNMAVSLAVERDDGTLKRLRATPMPPIVFFLGKIGLVVVTTVVQLALLLLVAKVGYDVPMPASSELWVRFGWLTLLGTAAGTVLGIGCSSIPRSSRSAAAVITPIVLVLQFISGIYFPYGNLPEWMRLIASIFPLKWMAQGMRSVFLPPQLADAEPGGSWPVEQIALVLVLWLVIGLVIALRTFRWQRRDDG